MKTALPILLCFCLWQKAAAQGGYWQQQVDFKIDVRLNDATKTLDGFETITYTNHSPDTLRFIWFHLWPNAYKNDRTALSEQLLQLGRTDFYFSPKEERGYINRLDFKVDGRTARWEDHPEHIDIIKIVLPQPLAPAQSATITTPFGVKLPRIFSRSGYGGNGFQIAQWYPKPAVYDAQGWHPMPYLEQGEFYGDFGNYDVTVTIPEPFVVAATGVLQNAEEKAWLRTRTAQAPVASTPTTKPKHGHLKKDRPELAEGLRAHNKTTDTANFFKPPYAAKTLRFTAENVHDFAFIARPDFVVNADTCRLASGRVIDIFCYYTAPPSSAWKKSLQLTKEALRFYAGEVGDYPYSTLHVAEGAGPFAGGMEYPTLAIITSTNSTKTLDLLIAHEVGHNWFYGALATNERDAPWLDEGFNTFYEKKYRALKYGDSGATEALGFYTQVAQRRDQPITTAAPDFSGVNYGLVAYYKAAEWLSWVEQKLGHEAFRKLMRDYYAKWRFKHPQYGDFKKLLSAALRDSTVFAPLHAKGLLPTQTLSRFEIVSPLLPRTLKKSVRQPAANRLLIAPMAGFNIYDKAMIGGLFTNYGLPPTALQFMALPLYATGSKKWNGIGSVKYTAYTKGAFQKVEGGLSGMGFSKRFLPDSTGTAHYERFIRIAPMLRATFAQPAHSSREAALEAKAFFIREHDFSKFVVKQADGLLYMDSLAGKSYYINQLTYTVNEHRVLYPYAYSLQLQQGKAFYRMNLSGEMFFNYAKGGGATVRFFFSRFGYLTSDALKRFGTARFQPKLLGNNGEEDFTYGSYFLGRTASYAADAAVVRNSGLAGQQILLRDGALKLRLDAFEFLQGRSDRWVAALNFNTTLPRQIVPAQIPLRLFFDIGTFAGAGEAESMNPRILYVGGLQLSLLRDAVNVYAPLVYSSLFRDNLKTLPEQNTFLRRLTFSIDLNRLSPQRFTRNQFQL